MTTLSPDDLGMALSERYMLARFPDGGVVVDLGTGNYFRLNGSAAAVCEALLGSAPGASVEARVSMELRIASDEARRLVKDLSATLRTPAVHGVLQGSYHFFPNDQGYELRHGERRVLEVNKETGDVQLARETPVPPYAQLEIYVRALAPKLLFQKGVTVLHAACVADKEAIAFAGLSGAGKTTTARAFAQAGARLVSEDLLVLSVAPTGSEIRLEGEGLIQGWARQVASALSLEPTRKVSSEGLTEVVAGPVLRLDGVLFLDSSRRAGEDFAVRQLPQPDALVGLMTHNFLGAGDPAAWRRFFTVAQTLLETVPAAEASAPLGLDRLPQAAGRYMSIWAS